MKDVTLRLSAAEHAALTHASKSLRLKPEELVWCGLDSVMNSIDQPSEAFGCILDTIRRFDEDGLPEWADATEGGVAC